MERIVLHVERSIFADMNTLSQRLAVEICRAIDDRETTVAELAAKVGCGRPYLYRVMDGRTIPSVDRAHELAEAIGASLEFQPKPKRKRKR